MKKARKTERRINFLNEIRDMMMNHERLDPKVIKRKNLKEDGIQESIFSHLNSKLSELINKYYDYSIEHSSKIIEENFRYEAKPDISLSNFPFLSAHHRPDADLKVKDLIRIGFEIKQGDSGHELRSGIGQSIVYASQYEFVLYFFVDTTPGRDIESARKSEKESAIIKSLWDNYNIKFFIV